jgi:signal peptidase II
MRYRPFALAAAIVGLDQLSKAWIVAEVPLGARVASWGGILHLTHTRNSGAAFGFLRDRTFELGAYAISGVQMLGMVSLAVAIALAVWLARSRTLGGFSRLALGAIMGGAIGNGIDRWRLGYVTDFLHAQRGWFDFPVFNVADIGITLGATALLLATFVGGRQHPADAAGGHPAAPPHGRPPPRPDDEDDAMAAAGASMQRERDAGPAEADALSDAPARTASDR